MERVILFTGKGGVGKSSIASATAAATAKLGRRTLLVSSDLAHNLSDIFQVKVGENRTTLAGNLTALEVNVLREIRDNWVSVQDYFAGFLAYLGMEDAVAEEVALIPGMDEIFLLARILREVESGDFDTIIVDCSPTAGTLRLLTLSDSSSTKLNKIMNIERVVIKLIRPFTKHIKGLKAMIPEDKVYDSFGELIQYIGRLGDLLKEPARSSVRLVLNPDRVAVAETRRAFTYFNLFGFPVDAILVNKVFPKELADGYFHQWWKIQSEELDVIERSFLDTTIFQIPYFDHEPLGLAPLEDMGKTIYADYPPDDVLSSTATVKLEKEGGKSRLSFLLPGLDKSSFDIGQRGADLLIHSGNHSRVFALPTSLTSAEVESARYNKDQLTIIFRPKEEECRP